ncbi:hypothetical protein F4781DRAFT_438168 [Annulohypoxylon bovei var. microspora]|nr:hypothetical protein F4781DRAFT_438168 [Annulohypoxylon bovei var. microspora]
MESRPGHISAVVHDDEGMAEVFSAWKRQNGGTFPPTYFSFTKINTETPKGEFEEKVEEAKESKEKDAGLTWQLSFSHVPIRHPYQPRTRARTHAVPAQADIGTEDGGPRHQAPGAEEEVEEGRLTVPSTDSCDIDLTRVGGGVELSYVGGRCRAILCRAAAIELPYGGDPRRLVDEKKERVLVAHFDTLPETMKNIALVERRWESCQGLRNLSGGRKLGRCCVEWKIDTMRRTAKRTTPATRRAPPTRHHLQRQAAAANIFHMPPLTSHSEIEVEVVPDIDYAACRVVSRDTRSRAVPEACLGQVNLGVTDEVGHTLVKLGHTYAMDAQEIKARKREKEARIQNCDKLAAPLRQGNNREPSRRETEILERERSLHKDYDRTMDRLEGAIARSRRSIASIVVDRRIDLAKLAEKAEGLE